MMVRPADELMRIWQIVEVYPPDYGGGTAIYVRDISRFLAERGHDVRVLCTERVDLPAYTIRSETLDGVRVDRLNLPYFRGQDPGGWRLGILGWRRHCRQVDAVVEGLLRDWQPDIVNFHTPYSLYEECLPAITRRAVPAVGLAHCAWLICPRLNLMRSPTNERCSGPAVLKCVECLYSHWDGTRLRAFVKAPWRALKLGAYPAYRLMRRWRARRRVSGVIACSEFMRTAHARRVPGPVVHIPLGINLDGLPADRPRRPRAPLRFGFAGGFQKHKGILQVLGAASSLRERRFAFQIHVWGPGQDAVAAEIAMRGLSGFVFARGMFAPEERWAVFSEIDTLLMASEVEEAFGRVVQEAAAMGVPTIAPAAGGISEQIRNGIDGLLYRFRDQADLERQMERILTEPGLYDRLCANLWRVLDTRQAVEAVEEFYLSASRKAAVGREASWQGRHPVQT